MKTPRPALDSATITRALRNSTTPQARLAAWQALPVGQRLAAIRKRLAPGNCTYAANVPMPANPADATIADWRRALIHDPAFYAADVPFIHEPESGGAELALPLDSPEILESWAGRTFLDHRGWFTDEDNQETIEAYAVRLARFPHLVFEATRDSMGGDLRVMLSQWEFIDYSECESEDGAWYARRDDAKDAIRSADSTAQRMAEKEREYQREESLKFQIEENKETLKTLRSEIRALCHELKQLCPSPLVGTYPAASKAVRDTLAALLRTRAQLMERNAKLAAEI